MFERTNAIIYSSFLALTLEQLIDLRRSPGVLQSWQQISVLLENPVLHVFDRLSHTQNAQTTPDTHCTILQVPSMIEDLHHCYDFQFILRHVQNATRQKHSIKS